MMAAIIESLLSCIMCRFDRFRSRGGLNSLDIEGMKMLMDKSGKEGGQL